MDKQSTKDKTQYIQTEPKVKKAKQKTGHHETNNRQI